LVRDRLEIHREACVGRGWRQDPGHAKLGPSSQPELTARPPFVTDHLESSLDSGASTFNICAAVIMLLSMARLSDLGHMCVAGLSDADGPASCPVLAWCEVRLQHHHHIPIELVPSSAEVFFLVLPLATRSIMVSGLPRLGPWHARKREDELAIGRPVD
jgi:hypothetical protein